MLTISAFFFSSFLLTQFPWYKHLLVFTNLFEHSCSVSSGLFSQSSILIVFSLYLLSSTISFTPRFLCSLIFWVPSPSMLAPQPQLLFSLTLKVFSSSPVPVWDLGDLLHLSFFHILYPVDQQIKSIPLFFWISVPLHLLKTILVFVTPMLNPLIPLNTQVVPTNLGQSPNLTMIHKTLHKLASACLSSINSSHSSLPTPSNP